MAQITLYLDDALQARLKDTAARQQLSQSQFVAQLIRQAVDDQWPAEVMQLAGALADFPLADCLREATGTDVARVL
jgi:predicted transcriptional regulator